MPVRPLPAELFSLWRELAAFSAAQTDAALKHLQTWLATAVTADNVIWVGAVRVLAGAAAVDDPFFGWRLRDRRPLHPDPQPYRHLLGQYYGSEHYGKLTPTYRSRSHEPKIDHVGLTGRASLAGTGRFRVHRLRDRDWIDFAAFRRTAHYRMYYRDAGILDRIWIGYPVNDRCESFFLIDRYRRAGRRLFTRAEADLAGLAVRSVPGLHRRLFLANGLATGDKPFSPAERRVLAGLLDGLTEKEIAGATGRRAGTTHHYVKGLYARYGVNSRAALMALWLKGG